MRASPRTVARRLGVAWRRRCVGRRAPSRGAESGCPRPAPRTRFRCRTSAAIERGAKAPASVSFGRPTAAGAAAAEEGAPSGPTLNAGSNPGGVRRLSPRLPTLPRSRGHLRPREPPSEISSTNRSGRPPEHHVVKKGDTLTSVCERYFADPWCWPQLWASNPHVTNPHWIFPGDILRLGSAAPAPRPPRPGMRLTSNRKGRLRQQVGAAARDRLHRHQGAGRERQDQRVEGREDHAGHRRPGLRQLHQGPPAAGRRALLGVRGRHQEPGARPRDRRDPRLPGARVRGHPDRSGGREEHGRAAF